MLNGFVAAIDPAAFPGAESFPAEVDRLARNLAAQPRADGFDEILMPGERGDRAMAKAARDGIELTPVLWKQLADVAGKLGVAMPEVL